MKSFRFSPEFLSLIAFFLLSFSAGVGDEVVFKNDPPFITTPSPWADSVIQSLTDEEKIAQLFMVAAYSNRDEKHEKELTDLIENYKIGGLIYFQGGPLRQAAMCNRLQSVSNVPLLIGMDAEWGLSMRLDSTVKYPWQMTLGAIQDESLIFDMGAQLGDQLKRLGVHVNFAPVIDINVNPNNPVINARSFGEQRDNVASKGIAYMKGLQSKHIIANAKHFPGHGDTDKDSHKTLPVINHTWNRLDSVELYPFKELMSQGLSSVMVAHLDIPALESEPNLASTLSKSIVSDLLKDSLKFQGLVITDALNMSGVSKFYKPGEVDLKALLAGNDILLFAQDVPKAIEQIQQAIKKGEVSMDEINKRCLKILRAKEWVGLNNYEDVKLDSLWQDLNPVEAQVLNRKLFQAAMTVLNNRDNLLPLKRLDTLKIAALAWGKKHDVFHRYLSMYAEVDTFSLPEQMTGVEQSEWQKRLVDYDLIIGSAHFHDRNPYSRTKIDASVMSLFQALRLSKKVVFASFANAYALNEAGALDHLDGLIQAYQNNEITNQLAAELIFGGIEAKGKLPVSINGQFRAGMGIDLSEPIRMNYVLPEEIDIKSSKLWEIDSIAMEGLIEGAYPGCQILVAKDGKIFYQRTFGYHTYDSTRQVKVSDVYDLASVTKISATLLGIMKLTEKGEIDLDYSLCDYLPDLVGETDYANLSLREILAHQAGLKAWIPFYKRSLISGKPRYDVYSLDSSAVYPRRVAENLYINESYEDSIFSQILSTPVNEAGEYKYSDIGYYFLKEIVESETGMPIEEYLQKEYYGPLGMNLTMFRPLNSLDKSRIIPTEDDKSFRRQLIHGDVHDPGAAMMGGVGGHAGLFGNANDMAKLMQMYVQGGEYGGVRFLDEQVLKEFTSCQYCENENRRGAGFDKPMIDGEEGGPTCTCVSLMSFGHSGFTGTYAWADPADEIVYIFLSNRIHPSATNKKLVKLSIRTRIQEVIYDAIYGTSTQELASDTLE